jgi:hypothetical protein
MATNAQVFVNYREDDDPSVAVLIDEELSRRFGPDRVFRAARSIPLGTPFPEAIRKALRSASVLLAVIGPRWLTATDPTGARRIDNPEDWVRLEIREALDAGVPVIPVLVDAPLPALADLPDDIARFVENQFLQLHHRGGVRDLERLVDELVARFPDLGGHTGRPYRWAIAGLVALMAVALTVGIIALISREPPGPAAERPRGGSGPTQSGVPFTPRLRPDPHLSPETQASRTVHLNAGDPSRQSVYIDHLRGASGYAGDLRIDGTRLYTNGAAGIALLSSREPGSYTRCAELPDSAWRTAIDLAELSAGAQLCGYSTDNKYAMLQILAVPSANNPEFVLFGRTWW